MSLFLLENLEDSRFGPTDHLLVARIVHDVVAKDVPRTRSIATKRKCTVEVVDERVVVENVTVRRPAGSRGINQDTMPICPARSAFRKKIVEDNVAAYRSDPTTSGGQLHAFAADVIEDVVPNDRTVDPVFQKNPYSASLARRLKSVRNKVARDDRAGVISTHDVVISYDHSVWSTGNAWPQDILISHVVNPIVTDG